MPWSRIDDGFVDHPKVVGLSHAAFRLHVSGLCYSARLLTDGFLPQADVPRLMRGYKRASVAELEAAGLWETVRGGWLIHDWLDFNPSAAQVKKDRSDKAERQRRWKQKRKGDASPNASQDASRDACPIPPHPGPKGLGVGTVSTSVDEDPAGAAVAEQAVDPRAFVAAIRSATPLRPRA